MVNLRDQGAGSRPPRYKLNIAYLGGKLRGSVRELSREVWDGTFMDEIQ